QSALRRDPGVHEAVVVVREDAPGDRRLVAYVVPRGPGVEPESLRALLRTTLPEHMIPAAFVQLDALPLTTNGKVDRRALPAPDASARASAHRRIAPRTPTQEVVAGIYAELLGLSCAGATDDFFALGGHSLLGTQAVSRVQAAFGVEIGLRALFESPTVEGLAARIDAARGAGAATAPTAIPRASRDGGLPLSFAQQRLWFLAELAPDSPTYVIPAVVRLDGPLDVAALGRTLVEVVRRHEALRTTF